MLRISPTNLKSFLPVFKTGEMESKYLMFVVALVAISTVAVAAMELAILSQMQQEADAIGCKTSTAFNASKGRCFRG